MAIEKYGYYEFEIKLMPDDEQNRDKWFYLIYGEDCLHHHNYDDGIIKSDEWFCTENQARFAAIGHIILLENGEG